MNFFHAMPRLFLFALLVFHFPACKREDQAMHGKVVVKYWEKWTGFEADAMREVINDFNASQDRIYVDYTSVSQIDRKFMLATSGGVPPDVAGLWSNLIPAYAENNALTPLDKMAGEAGVRRENYIDVVWQLCSHRGHLWALPSTPTSVALVWNKKLFREAGLDPDQPPRSIAELERYNEKLTRYRPDGRLQSIGFLPEDTDWWDTMWGFWFGGKLWDGERTVTANSPENIAAYQWIESYPKRFGADNLIAFRAAFGNYTSPEHPFISGRVAMELQGVWIYNFIKMYAAPDFEWGVAAFPSADPARLKDVSIVDSDVLAIPAGAKHPREAFEFIKYINSQKPMEKLCLSQLKFSPLRECSPEFLRNHPHPYIKKFIELANSPNAVYIPRIPTWTEYNSDMRNAVGKIWSGKQNAADALEEVEKHQQQIFNDRYARWERLSAKLMSEWNKQ
jgi:ABC-type glycerol-3-phosphate transport system substrate-binding protein